MLAARVKAGTTAQRDVLRARIILAAPEHGVRASARLIGCAISTVVKWRGAATNDPPEPFTTWSHQRLADHLAALRAPAPSPSWVGRALAQAHIRVHRVRGWLHRKPDPRFEERIAAIEDAVAAARAGAAAVVCAWMRRPP